MPRGKKFSKALDNSQMVCSRSHLIHDDQNKTTLYLGLEIVT